MAQVRVVDVVSDPAISKSMIEPFKFWSPRFPLNDDPRGLFSILAKNVSMKSFGWSEIKTYLKQTYYQGRTNPNGRLSKVPTEKGTYEGQKWGYKGLQKLQMKLQGAIHLIQDNFLKSSCDTLSYPSLEIWMAPKGTFK